jgi:hypothetical protein
MPSAQAKKPQDEKDDHDKPHNPYDPVHLTPFQFPMASDHQWPDNDALAKPHHNLDQSCGKRRPQGTGRDAQVQRRFGLETNWPHRNRTPD